MKSEQKYNPLQRAGDVLFLACSAAISILVSVMSVVKIASDQYSWQAGFGGAVAAVIGFFFVLSVRKCGDELFSFREYWKRNVRGYYKVFTWTWLYDGSCVESDKNNPFYVERRKLRVVLTMKRSPQLTIAIPFGGWFAKPRMVCDWEDVKGWRIKTLGTSRDPDFQSLWLLDNHGSRVATTVQMVAKLANIAKSCYLRDVLTNLLGYYDRLLESERELREARGILSQAIRQIEDTKRFQHSKEGARIREWLTRELIGLLPEGDPRRPELQAKLEKLTTSVGN